MNFDGETYDEELDGERMTTQLELVREIMSDQGWHRIIEVANRVDCTESGAAARIRDLRKEKFGSWEIMRRRVAHGNGLHEYRWTGEIVEPAVVKRANTDWKELYDNLLDRLMEIDRMTGTDVSYRYAVEELIDIENKNMNRRWL
jgi:hypothetical protein